MKEKNWSHPSGELARDSAGEVTLMASTEGAGRLTNAATTQAQKQGYEVDHPNILSIWDLQGHMD